MCDLIRRENAIKAFEDMSEAKHDIIVDILNHVKPAFSGDMDKCDTCYYRVCDENEYPCSRCIFNIPRECKYLANAVVVTYCKDCKHNNNTCRNHGKMEPMCDFTRRKLKEMDFCSYGERREE